MLKKLKSTVLVCLIVLSMLAIYVVPSNVPLVEARANWLSGWGYRTSHVINPATGAGANYQVKIRATYTAQGTINGILQGCAPNRVQTTAILTRNTTGGWDETLFAPRIIMVGSQRRMYYGGSILSSGDTAVGYAYATDPNEDPPVTWTKYSGNPVFSKSSNGADWDGGTGGIRLGSVIKIGTTYYLYYASNNAATQIGVATSSDGVTWARYGGNPILSPSGSEYFVTVPYVIAVGSTYYMYYTTSAGASPFSPNGVSVASSSDGLAWNKVGVVLGLGAAGTFDDVYIEDHSVYQSSDGYVIVYEGYDGAAWSIGAASNVNPTGTFTKYSLNPIFQKSSSAGTFDKFQVATAAWYKTANGLYFFYQGGDNATYANAYWNLGLARFSDLLLLNSNCRTDFGDVRFTDDNGTTLLSYYMNSKVDGDYANFWVKIADSLESSAQTIFVYYDEPAATTTSSGVDTFPFFDTGASNRSSEYTLRNIYGANLNAALTYNATGSCYKVDVTADDLVVAEINSLAANGAYEISSQLLVDSAPASGNIQIGLMMRYTTGGVYYDRRISALNVVKSMNIHYEANPPNNTQVELVTATSTSYIAANTWYNARGNAYGSAFSFWFELNNQTVSGTSTAQSTGTWGLHVGYLNTVNYYFKNTWVRNYTSPEPTQGTWQAEESYEIYSIAVYKNTPANATTITSSTVDFKFTPVWHESVPINACVLIDYWNTSLGIDVWNTTALVNNTINTISHTFNGNGSHYWNAYMYNTTSGGIWSDYDLNHLGGTDWNFTVSYYIDNEPPTFWVWDYNIPYYMNFDVTVKGRWNDASDLSHYLFSINATGPWQNQTWTPFDDPTPPAWTGDLIFNLTGNVGDTVSLLLYANDTNGNVGKSNMLNLTLNAGANLYHVALALVGAQPFIGQTITVSTSVTYGFGVPVDMTVCSMNISRDGTTFKTNYSAANFTDSETAVDEHVYNVTGFAVIGDDQGFDSTPLTVAWRTRPSDEGTGGGGGGGGGGTIDIGPIQNVPSWAVWAIVIALIVVFLGGVVNKKRSRSRKNAPPKRSFNEPNNRNRR